MEHAHTHIILYYVQMLNQAYTRISTFQRAIPGEKGHVK